MANDETRRLDLSPADVHLPGGMGAEPGKRAPGAKKKSRKKRAAEKRRMRGRLAMTVTHPSGHTVRITHLTDSFEGVAVLPSIPLSTDDL